MEYYTIVVLTEKSTSEIENPLADNSDEKTTDKVCFNDGSVDSYILLSGTLLQLGFMFAF